MAGKPKRMSQIKQLILLHEQGKGIKTIARELGISKNTVRTYLSKLKEGKLEPGQLLQEDDPVLEGKLFAGNPAYKDPRYDTLKGRLPYYAAELKKTGVTRQLLWDEYRSSHPGGYGYTQFCYHLSQYLVARKPTMVLTHKAGDKLYIDYAGKKLSYVNRETGEVIECQVFVATLPYSDYCFAMAVRSQGIEDFIYALKCCLQALGGVPSSLVPDNLKSAVIKAHRYEPEINQAMEDFANHYGTCVIPARARKPQDKALVENQVRLIYSRVYAQLREQTFFDLPSLNAAIAQKVAKHNQTRMQQHEYCREEKFLAQEKVQLRPLPQSEYEIKYYRDLKVAKNNHLYLSCDKHYYSVPYTFIGKQVRVIYTRTLVHIYAQHQRIALHQRERSVGRYTTQKEHLCSHHNHYQDRSPDYYQQKAQQLSPKLHQVFVQLFQQKEKHPEQLYRSCDGILSLQRQTPTQEFEQACSLLLEVGNYSYGFLKNIIANRMALADASPPLPQNLPLHENTRGADYFQ